MPRRRWRIPLAISILAVLAISGCAARELPGAGGATQTASFTIPDGGNDTDTMALSLDGKFLALQVADATPYGPTSTIYLFDIATQKQLRTFPTTGVPASGLFAFGPGDATLTEVTDGGPVLRWNLSTGKRTTIMAATPGNAAISADGETLATGSGAGVVIWNLDTGARIADLTSPDKHKLVPRYAISLDGNGERVAAGYPDGKAYVWNVATRKVIATLPDAEYTDNGKLSVRLSPDGKTAEIPGANADPPTLWDIATQSNVTPHDPDWPAKPSVFQADYPNANDFSTDSQAYVTNSQPFDDLGNVANVWNLRTHSHIATVNFPGGAPYYVEAVGPAGKELLAYGYDGTNIGDGTLAIWTIH
jgi:WD40 repeat protein